MRCKHPDNIKFWEVCPFCEDGYTHHDCGDDTCCCLYPEPNMICEECGGEGGYDICPICNPLFV